MKLPKSGISKEQVLSNLLEFKSHDVNWEDGKVFGYVYSVGDEASALLRDAANMFQHQSALDLSAFPSSMQLEKAVLSMSIDLVNGGDKAEGSFTSGGTESILLAVKSARDYAADVKGITNPNIILPQTAHPAFIKACEYFKVEYISVPVNISTFKADPEAMESFINKNTIMLVASAPSYGTGTIDPIEELGRIALVHDLLFTVDACMGGMVLPFMNDLGYNVPPFDLSVPGVTAICIDFHKYGYANKSSSAVIYKEGKLMRGYQMFTCSSWTGYSIVNTTIASTKSTGPLASTYAIMNYLGREGYKKIVKDKIEATDKIINAVTQSRDLYIVGCPEVNLISIASEVINIFELADNMKSRGWFIQPQLGYGPLPASVHLSIGAQNMPRIDEFIADLLDELKNIKSNSDKSIGKRADKLSSLTETIKTKELVKLRTINNDDHKMGVINTVLNNSSIATRDSLLSDFINEQYSTTKG